MFQEISFVNHRDPSLKMHKTQAFKKKKCYEISKHEKWDSKITPWNQTPQNQKIQNPVHTKLNSNHKYQTPKN